MCEKICDTLPHMIIGNVIDGFAIEKVMNQNNIAKITESMCKKCWAIQHCTVCAAVADDGQTLSKEKILFECSLIRKNTESKMLDMIAIYEARNVLVKPKGENML